MERVYSLCITSRNFVYSGYPCIGETTMDELKQLKGEIRLLEKIVKLLNKWGEKCQKRETKKRAKRSIR